MRCRGVTMKSVPAERGMKLASSSQVASVARSWASTARRCRRRRRDRSAKAEDAEALGLVGHAAVEVGALGVGQHAAQGKRKRRGKEWRGGAGSIGVKQTANCNG